MATARVGLGRRRDWSFRFCFFPRWLRYVFQCPSKSPISLSWQTGPGLAGSPANAQEASQPSNVFAPSAGDSRRCLWARAAFCIWGAGGIWGMRPPPDRTPGRRKPASGPAASPPCSPRALASAPSVAPHGRTVTVEWDVIVIDFQGEQRQGSGHQAPALLGVIVPLRGPTSLLVLQPRLPALVLEVE
jgi:hypothetical protein